MSCSKYDLDLPLQPLVSPTQIDLHDICFESPSVGYIVGGERFFSGILLTTTDGGLTWALDTLTGLELNAVDCLGVGELRIAGFGSRYVRRSPSLPLVEIELPENTPSNGIDYWDASNGIIVGGGSFGIGASYAMNGDLVVAHDSLGHEMTDVVMTDAQTAHAVGYGLIMMTTDGGLTWEYNSTDGDFFKAVDFPSVSIGYAVGFSGNIVKTIDGGQSWETLRNGNRLTVSDTQFRDVHFYTVDEGFACGNSGLLWHTGNGGITWSKINTGVEQDLYAMKSIDRRLYVVGTQGGIWTLDF